MCQPYFKSRLWRLGQTSAKVFKRPRHPSSKRLTTKNDNRRPNVGLWKSGDVPWPIGSYCSNPCGAVHLRCGDRKWRCCRPLPSTAPCLCPNFQLQKWPTCGERPVLPERNGWPDRRRTFTAVYRHALCRQRRAEGNCHFPPRWRCGNLGAVPQVGAGGAPLHPTKRGKTTLGGAGVAQRWTKLKTQTVGRKFMASANAPIWWSFGIWRHLGADWMFWHFKHLGQAGRGFHGGGWRRGHVKVGLSQVCHQR